MKSLSRLAAFAALVTCLPGQATIIDHGWYTEDSRTGLYWLDWTATRAHSYNEVIAQSGPGQRFDGWRHATYEEIETLYANFGLTPTGGDCYEYLAGLDLPSVYCGPVAPVQAELLETAIRMLGDTDDAYALSFDRFGVATASGTNGSRGIINAYNNPDGIAVAALRDWELVDRANGTLSDSGDYIWSYGLFTSQQIPPKSYFSQTYGHALVRNTLPTINPTPPPPDDAIDFDAVVPADLGIQFVCQTITTPTTKYACDGNFAARNSNASWLWLGITDEFDANESPLIRITGFDYTWIESGMDRPTCTSGDLVYSRPASVSWTAGSEYPVTVEPAPQGGGWCRATFDASSALILNSTETAGVPAIPGVPGVRLAIQMGLLGWNSLPGSPDPYGIGFDNIVLDKPGPNIEIDFDPSSELNEIRPKERGFYYVAIKQTRVADGDLYDFDAWSTNWQFLRFGPDGATNTIESIIRDDYDHDGDDDWIVGFRVEDSGLTCADFKVAMSGIDVWHKRIWGSDTVVPVGCEETVVIDVDPWSAANEVRPNDSYMIPVGILSKSIANGDDADLDAADIDPDSLAFGPGMAPDITFMALADDLNDDSLTDLIFGFNSVASGIACGDTEVELTGYTFEGLPIEGTGAITTMECETSGCHP